MGAKGSQNGSLCIIGPFYTIRLNDLVFVDASTQPGSGKTIRRISQIVTNNGGFLYEASATQSNAIDSRQLGLLKRSQIHGKVFWVMK